MLLQSSGSGDGYIAKVCTKKKACTLNYGNAPDAAVSVISVRLRPFALNTDLSDRTKHAFTVSPLGALCHHPGSLS
ncbi:protein of unknown function [Methylocaldum szegediense]|uniref:Uncharacterized protein n=1 Tax=Methylocaldum szegediense TaxID=73780 RepID=A0ABM9I5J0_9GAMM|nr:protein of unknown function [Methylocaldum szegediense]